MIYITGDIHGDIMPLLEFIEEQQLGAADTIILLGDAGLNFYGNHQGDGKKKQRLNKTGVTIFCIHGNHEKRPHKLSYISWYCGHWHINKRIDNMHFLMECKETLPTI